MDILVTKRLTLRPPLEVDADDIFSGISNPGVARNLSELPHPYLPEHACQWIARKSKENSNGVFTIHREKLIGVVEVSQRTIGEPPVLGYWLAQPYWGRGYMKEASRAAIAHAFRASGTDTIRSSALTDNEGSLRVMDYLGFTPVGEATLFNALRGEEYPAMRTELTRDKFERLFGSLEAEAAA